MLTPQPKFQELLEALVLLDQQSQLQLKLDVSEQLSLGWIDSQRRMLELKIQKIQKSKFDREIKLVEVNI